MREFTDHAGREWRVWDIRPNELPNATRVEDYLRPLVDGWLVFESADGAEKRRVYPVPANWDEMDDLALERLRDVAAPIERSRDD